MCAKYLYCKYSNLESFIKTGKWLRFTDIAQYINRENEIIRDDESERSYVFTPKTIKRFTDGHVTLSRKQIKAVTFSLKTRRCHALCLSNKKNDGELFKRFNADACLELNVKELIGAMKEFFKKKVNILSKNVEYFDTDTGMGGDATALVFQKNNAFKIENEYRIALFYPFDERTVLVRHDNSKIKVFGAHDYIGISINDKITLNNIVVGVAKI